MPAGKSGVSGLEGWYPISGSWGSSPLLVDWARSIFRPTTCWYLGTNMVSIACLL